MLHVAIGHVAACAGAPDDLVTDDEKTYSPRMRRRHVRGGLALLEKKAMMELIAAQAADAHALVMSPCPLRERESVRQALLTELATVVSRHPAVEVTIESRDSHNDRLDRASLIRARQAGAMNDDTSYVHRQPVQEPLLWLADALAGAVRAGTLHDATYLRLLPEDLLTLRQVSDLSELGERRR